MASVSGTTHPQLRARLGTRAMNPNATNTAVAPTTSVQSSQVRYREGPPVPSPASAARTYAGSMP